MILSICNNSTILSIFRIVKILIRIITISVPLILIISSMMMLLKNMQEGNNELVSKSLKSLVTKTIAAILIFLIPTFVRIIDDISSANINYESCIKGATSEGIDNALYDEALALVKTAKEKLRKSDYQVALSKVKKIKDDSKRESLLKELVEVKKKIDLSEEVNRLLGSGTEEDYNRLLEKVNKLEDGEFKKSLLALLEKMKKRIEEESVGNAKKVLSSITNHPPKEYKKNITVNYYEASNGQKFTFWLSLPNEMKAGLPIIFFMHDLGCRGNDYFDGTTASIWGGPIREVIEGNKNWQAIIVHAQVPSNERSQEYRDSYVELLNKLAEGFKADTKKISVMGFSNGCYGVWSIVNAYQNYFSAAVPIGCSTEYVSPYIFSTTPMWSLVGSGDGARNMPGFAQTVNGINGNSKHSFSKYHSHNCLYPAPHEGVLLEYDVVEWMLNQTRK